MLAALDAFEKPGSRNMPESLGGFSSRSMLDDPNNLVPLDKSDDGGELFVVMLPFVH